MRTCLRIGFIWLKSLVFSLLNMYAMNLSTIFYNDCNSSLLRLCEQIFNNQDDLNSLSILFSIR